MIKFFRKIRLKLLSEGKKLSYLNRNYFSPLDREKVRTKSKVQEGLIFYSDRLLEISRKKWEDENIELELMNAILFRTEVAAHHHNTAERMQDETNALIELLTEISQ